MAQRVSGIRRGVPTLRAKAAYCLIRWFAIRHHLATLPIRLIYLASQAETELWTWTQPLGECYYCGPCQPNVPRPSSNPRNRSPRFRPSRQSRVPLSGPNDRSSRNG